MKSGLAHVLDQIEREKGIRKEDIIKMIEQAMVSAYRKHAGDSLHVEAHIDSSGDIRAYIVKTIVKSITDENVEIRLADAKKINKKAAVGGEVRYPIDPEEFGRIAAQTAKQVLTQKIRETEREFIFEEFKPKEGILVNGTIHRFANKNLIVDLGKAEGILPVREQVRRERWRVGERIRVLIQKVEKGPRGPEIFLTRAHEDFVKRIFEQEVPEIYEKTVQVMSVVREPGQRSKVVVQSFNPKVDPIGACVGVKGSRVRPIINELQGERIDLVAFSEDPATFIAASLAPAKPLSVTIVDAEKKHAEALVADDALSLAIGKNGQNVRLAGKLTGWQIDIKAESQRKKETQANISAVKEMLLQLEGVGPRIADVLIKGGKDSIDKIAASSVDDLTVYAGIGEKMAEKLIASAKETKENPPAAAAPVEETAASQPDAPDLSATAKSASAGEKPKVNPEEKPAAQRPAEDKGEKNSAENPATAKETSQKGSD